MVRILDGIWNLEAQPFEIQMNGHHFVKNHLKSGQKCQDFGWFGLQMVGTKAMTQTFEIWPSKNMDFKWFRISWSDFRSSLYIKQSRLVEFGLHFAFDTIGNQTFNKFEFRQISSFQRVGFQIPTVFKTASKINHFGCHSKTGQKHLQSPKLILF